MAADETVQVSFPGGLQVLATVGGHAVMTDQPLESGGGGEAPSPYSLFLASIGACAGYYALAFCRKREVSTEGLEVLAHPRREEGTLAGVEIQVKLPEGFPERYRSALLRSIDQCSVKRAIQAQPEFKVEIR